MTFRQKLVICFHLTLISYSSIYTDLQHLNLKSLPLIVMNKVYKKKSLLNSNKDIWASLSISILNIIEMTRDEDLWYLI